MAEITATTNTDQSGIHWRMVAMRFALAAALLVASPALAQQSQTPLEQALGAKLMAEIGTGLQCSATDKHGGARQGAGEGRGA
jgi:hypothetical protein